MNKINVYQEEGYATILNCTIREPVFKLKIESKTIKESEEIIFPCLESDSIKNKSTKSKKKIKQMLQNNIYSTHTLINKKN